MNECVENKQVDILQKRISIYYINEEKRTIYLYNQHPRMSSEQNRMEKNAPATTTNQKLQE